MFTDIDDLRLYAQGVEASLDIAELNVSIKKAETAISSFISKEVYDSIRATDAEVKYAVANFAMYKYLLF